MEQNQIVIYQTEDGQTQIDVRLENETVWLTQAQMVTLFKSSRTNILEHIQHIYEDDELDESSTCRKFRQVQKEGNRMVNRTKTMYNLDMIISVGYRVNTKRGIKFRQWANKRLCHQRSYSQGADWRTAPDGSSDRANVAASGVV